MREVAVRECFDCLMYRCNVNAKDDEINVPLALSAFRDKGSRLWSCGKKEKKKKGFFAAQPITPCTLGREVAQSG